jgi:hypothetical protein
MRYSWLRDVHELQLLPEDYREIVEIIGLNNFVRLLRAFDKTAIYFSRRLLQPLLNRYIAEHQNIPARKLAKELKISVRYIYKVRKTFPTIQRQG